jgi:hypothetical protein
MALFWSDILSKKGFTYPSISFSTKAIVASGNTFVNE